MTNCRPEDVPVNSDGVPLPTVISTASQAVAEPVYFTL